MDLYDLALKYRVGWTQTHPHMQRQITFWEKEVRDFRICDKIIRDGISLHPCGLRSRQKQFSENMSKLNQRFAQSTAALPTGQSETLDILTQRKRSSFTGQHVKLGRTYIYVDEANREAVIPIATQNVEIFY